MKLEDEDSIIISIDISIRLPVPDCEYREEDCMPRSFNQDANGQPFDHKIVEKVWHKARTSIGYPPQAYRYDDCNHVICFKEYGLETEYGWEIDHIRPIAHGGSDDPSNLRPLHWKLNRQKGDQYPWSCDK
jgi:hypothetical protein